MGLVAVTCPYCHSAHIPTRGTTDTGKQRSHGQNPNCPLHSFLLNPAYKGRVLEIKEPISDMARHGSGIRDTAEVLGISTDTFLHELKKKRWPSAG